MLRFQQVQLSFEYMAFAHKKTCPKEEGHSKQDNWTYFSFPFGAILAVLSILL